MAVVSSTSSTSRTGQRVGLEHVIAEVVARDPVLQSRVRALIITLLTEAERSMKWGTPAVKARLMSTAVPAMIRTLGDNAAKDDLEELRGEFAKFQAEMRGYTTTTAAIETTTREIPADTPR